MTTFLANTGGQTVTGNVTRVLQSDLDQLSSFLQQKFNYAAGPYEGYDRGTPSTRFLGKLVEADETLLGRSLDSATEGLLGGGCR